MLRAYILRRILATIPVLAVVALFTFTLLRIVPGDPAAVLAGHEATREDVEQIRTRLGLDKPLPVQLGVWISQLARGDLGNSIRKSDEPVLRLIASRVEPTLSLTLITEIAAVLIAVPLGVLAAWKANSWIDRLVNGLCGGGLFYACLLGGIHTHLGLRPVVFRPRLPLAARGWLLALGRGRGRVREAPCSSGDHAGTSADCAHRAHDAGEHVGGSEERTTSERPGPRGLPRTWC